MKLVLVWAVGLLLTWSPAGAQGLVPLTVRVKVAAKVMELPPSCAVTVTRQGDDASVVTGSTDAGGSWQGSLPPGDYVVVVSAPGFKTKTYPLTLVNTPSADPVVVESELELGQFESVVLDDTCAYDPLYEIRTWRLCSDELTQLPID